LIGEQGAEDGTQFQQLMPVLVRARQAAHLQAEDDADMVEADLGQQILKTEPSGDALPAAPLVFVDDFDTVLRPTQYGGALDQGVLPVRRFPMLEHLLGR
jgi:hypothetical protein